MRLLIVMLVVVLLAPAWAQSATETLVQRLVASPKESWPSLLDANPPFEPELLQDIAQKAVKLPLVEARQTAEACDELAFRASRKYTALAQLGLARAYLRDGKKTEALAVASNLAGSHPELTDAHMLRGFCLLETAQYDAARGVFEQVTRTSPFYELAWLELGRAEVFLNHREQALAAFRQVLSINPDNGFARDTVASLSGTQPALRLKANPEARAHFEKAEGFFAQRQFPEAIAEYRLAAQADPRFAKPLVYIGDCHFQLGDVEQAIASYQAALQVDPQDKQAHRFLGEMFERKFDRTGDGAWLDQAIACYRAALKADPAYGAAQTDLQRAEGKRR